VLLDDDDVERRKVKVKSCNCCVVEGEETRLQKAMQSQDRDTIRSIMAARQARKMESKKKMEEEVEESGGAWFDKEDFSCPVCRNLLYKPVINSCGHAFCFWCMHRAMNAIGESNCPVCRCPYTQLAAPLEPLHRFLLRAFPEESAARQEETVEAERTKFLAQSPRIEPSDETNGFIGPVDVADLLCGSCHNVVQDPVVPACGHLVCRGCVAPGGGSESNRDQVHLMAAPSCPKCDMAILSESNSNELKVCSVLTILLATVESVDKAKLEALVEKERNTASIGNVNSTDSGSTPTIELPEIRSNSSSDFVHFAVGCDGCGEYPVRGHAFRCLDCPEQIGFDLCQKCFLRGAHLLPGQGRFNQSHTAPHRFEEREQKPNGLHMLMERHPELTPAQIMQFVQWQTEAVDDRDDGAAEESDP
jgi:hypothetical protein